MARRLQTVVYDGDPDPRVESLFTGFALGAGASRQQQLVRQSMRVSRTHRYRIAPVAGGGYTANTPVTITQAAHGGDLLAQWAAIELFWDAPTGTTVQARLHDGAGSSWYWDGGAWVAAGSNWNTPEDLMANFASFSATDAVRLGVQWELTTTDKEVTPYAYGFLLAGRLVFGARSGATAQATRSDGWMDDLIHRTVLPWIQSNLAPEVTDEQENPGQLRVIDYANGVGYGETNYVVRDVQAVYDLDADPSMLTPLSGTWDSSDKTYTLDAALDECSHWAARVVYEPIVAYAGKSDYFDSRLPQVLIEEVTEQNDEGSPGNVLVRDCANDQALATTCPRELAYVMTLLVQSDDHVTAWELAESIKRMTNGQGGVLLVSPNTGMAVSLKVMNQLRPARGDQTVESVGRFDLMAWTREYHGTESTVPLLKQDGFTTTIAPSQTVVAR